MASARTGFAYVEKLIEATLQRHETALAKFGEDLEAVKLEMARLVVRVGLVCAVSSMIVTAIVSIIIGKLMH